jgi:hypothetical protein
VQATVQNDGAAVWGAYPNYDDIARFEYGRRFWRDPKMRARLLDHWLDERHPHRTRFLEQRELVELVLSSDKSEAELDADLREKGTSLRCVTREIPPVFGSFFTTAGRR